MGDHYHDGVIKWKHFPRYWPVVRGIHRSPVNSPHKGQWRGALMFSLICARINGWVKREAGDSRRHRALYDVTAMVIIAITPIPLQWFHNERDCVSNYRRLNCLPNRLFRRRSKKNQSSMSLEGNPPVTGGLPAQGASNAKNVSIWWAAVPAEIVFILVVLVVALIVLVFVCRLSTNSDPVLHDIWNNLIAVVPFVILGKMGWCLL